MDGPGDVAVFWDYENCATPTHASGYEVVAKIRRLAHMYGSVKVFKAYLEISGYSSPKTTLLRSQLQLSGLSLTDCPHNGQKEVADKMMLVDMMAYAIDHPEPSTIVVITGDRDFAYALAVLRLRRYRVVVVGPSNTHASLVAQASLFVDWHLDVVGKGKTSLGSSPNNSLVGGDPSISAKGGCCTATTCHTPSLDKNKSPARSVNHTRSAEGVLAHSSCHQEYLSSLEQMPSLAEPASLLPSCLTPQPPTGSLDPGKSFLHNSTDTGSPYSTACANGDEDLLQIWSASDANTRSSNASTFLLDATNKKTSPKYTKGHFFTPILEAELLGMAASPAESMLTDVFGSEHRTTEACSIFGQHSSASYSPLSPIHTLSSASGSTCSLHDLRSQAAKSDVDDAQAASSHLAVSNPGGSSTSVAHPLARIDLKNSPSRPVPIEYKILQEVLEAKHKAGVDRPSRSILGSDLHNKDKSYCTRAGATSFRSYITAACNAGIVKEGGNGNTAWVALREPWRGSVRLHYFAMSNEEKVAIFWDLDTCYPSANSGYRSVSNIRERAHTFGTITLFKGYLKENPHRALSPTFRSELQLSGVSLAEYFSDVNVTPILIVDLLTYAMDTRAPSTIMLITANCELSYPVAVLRQRKYHVIVVAPSLSALDESLRFQASVCLDWKRHIEGTNFQSPENLGGSRLLDVHQAGSRVSKPIKRQSEKDALLVNTKANDHEATSFGIQKPRDCKSPPLVFRRDAVSQPPNFQGDSYPQQYTRASRAGSARCSPTTDIMLKDTLLFGDALEGIQSVPGTASISRDGKSYAHDVDVLRGRPVVEPSIFRRDSISTAPSIALFNPEEVSSDTWSPRLPAMSGNGISSLPPIIPTKLSESIGAPAVKSSFRDGHIEGDPQTSTSHGGKGFEASLQIGDLSQNPPLSSAPSGPPDALGEGIPSSIRPLITLLRSLHSEGKPKPLRSLVGAKIQKSWFNEANVTTFSQYVALAEKLGFVEVGGFAGTAWISLKVE